MTTFPRDENGEDIGSDIANLDDLWADLVMLDQQRQAGNDVEFYIAARVFEIDTLARSLGFDPSSYQEQLQALSQQPTQGVVNVNDDETPSEELNVWDYLQNDVEDAALTEDVDVEVLALMDASGFGNQTVSGAGAQAQPPADHPRANVEDVLAGVDDGDAWLKHVTVEEEVSREEMIRQHQKHAEVQKSAEAFLMSQRHEDNGESRKEAAPWAQQAALNAERLRWAETSKVAVRMMVARDALPDRKRIPFHAVSLTILFGYHGEGAVNRVTQGRSWLEGFVRFERIRLSPNVFHFEDYKLHVHPDEPTTEELLLGEAEEALRWILSEPGVYQYRDVTTFTCVR